MMGGLEPEGESVSVDTSVPHIARVYDYWLGGKDNFAVDRATAEQVIATFPDILRPATSPPTRWPPRCRSTTST
jgi:hypothetical protein